MATENRGVMVYLPADIEEYFTQYCTENDITRKDKESGNTIPSLGTGIIAYLKSQILGIAPSHAPAEVATPHTKMQLSIDQLTTELTELRSEVAKITQLEVEPAKITELAEEVAEIKKLISGNAYPLPPTAKEPSPPPNEILTELVTSGLRATAIATNLNQLGYTNNVGKPLTRENVSHLIRSDSSLKQTYELAATKPTTTTQEPS